MPNQVQLFFPDRKERKAQLEELKKLGADALKEEQYAAAYQNYLDAMNQLDRLMDAASAEEDGLPGMLNAEDREKLLSALMQAGLAGEELIVQTRHRGWKRSTEEKKKREGQSGANPINDGPAEPEPRLKWPEEQLAESVNLLQSLAAKDFSALQAYDPGKPKSLPELQTEGRTQIIDLRGRKFETVGNQVNRRMKIQLVNAKGEKINGFFTKATYLETVGPFKQLLETAIAACDQLKASKKDPNADLYKKKLNNFISDFRKKTKRSVLGTAAEMGQNTPEHLVIGFFLCQIYQVFGAAPIGPMDLDADVFRGLFKDLPKSVKMILAKGFTEMKDCAVHEMFTHKLALPDRARMDNRNSGMSSVAAVLGVPQLLARSVNMKFIGEDNQVTEGSFMEHARGLDLENNRSLFQHVSKDPFSEPALRGKVFKQIADLQVLDFICMNQDRHFGNMFFEVNEKGQIIGIQGIDNDCSFARGLQFNLKARNLGVISQSMADKVGNLNTEMLKFALRGQGLSEEELKFAGLRLEQLQNAIQNHQLQILSDADFEKKTLKDLEKYDLFKKVKDRLEPKLEHYCKDQVTPLPNQQEPNFQELGTNARKLTVGGLKDSLENISRLVADPKENFRVDKLVKFGRGQSGAFKKLVETVKRSALLRGKLLQEPELRDETIITDPAAAEINHEAGEAFGNLETAARAYLSYKAGSKGDPDAVRGRNPYEQSHIDYARRVLQTVELYKETMRISSREDELLLQDNLNRQTIRQQKEQNPLILNV